MAIPLQTFSEIPAHTFVEIVDVTNNAVMVTDKKTRLSLAGVEILNQEKANAHLTTLIGKKVRIENSHTNRYGDLYVYVFDDEQLVQETLIKKGYAITYGTQPDVRLGALLAMETPENYDAISITESEAEKAIGRFRVVTGDVHEVVFKKQHTYINFAADWKSDFTIYVPRDVMKSIGQETLESLKGKTVSVRGYIDKYYGPRVNVYVKEMLSYESRPDSH